jgi:predicted metalloprotease with PDZ domain
MASGLHFFFPYFFTFTKNKTVITGLKEDSSAMASGLQPGDVLTMVDGFDVLQHPAAQVSPSPHLPLFTNERQENKIKNKKAK